MFSFSFFFSLLLLFLSDSSHFGMIVQVAYQNEVLEILQVWRQYKLVTLESKAQLWHCCHNLLQVNFMTTRLLVDFAKHCSNLEINFIQKFDGDN